MFKVLARDPRLLQRQLAGSVGYIEPSHISMRQREVFLLRVAGRSRCEYEWSLRVHFFAEDVGLTTEQIDATTAENPKAAGWSAEDRLLLALADSLHDSCEIEDELWAALKDAFSDEALLQLLILAGYYRTVAYLANGLKLAREPGLGRGFPTSSAPTSDARPA